MYIRSKMESIHFDKEYKEEYKEQFRNMTDEQIEYHIGLEKVRNVIEGFDKDFEIDEIRKLVEEVKHEKRDLETKKCNHCHRVKEDDKYKTCEKCRTSRREYHHKNRERLNENRKLNHQKNKEHDTAYWKEYHQNNRDKMNERKNNTEKTIKIN